MRLIRSSALVTVATAAVMVAGSVPAWASTTSSTDGAVVNYLTSNNSFNVCDTAPDGHAVYVDWRSNNQSGRYQNSAGNGSCPNSGPISGISNGASVRFRACENVNNGFDDCDDWETTTG